ncbi:MAG: extracellular solute-binding protein [Chloroflexi bacterium]|uniref:ABC transporter substrate-binding protein n=1 Tax=Candidatus Flexifilum breve TaxID=3140694 RepID=UPI0031347C06|nr:extracellular solute-binding protein [Chloroflexota bacterium]
MKKFVVLLAILSLLVVSTSFVMAQDAIALTIRCKANTNGGEGWRCDNFAQVEEQVEAALGIQLDLTLIQDDKDWGEYKNEFVLASEAGEAPDIILSGHEDIGAWAPAGYIMPLDELIGAHPEFADVVPTLWDSQMWDGQTWGVPQDAEARPIFYSKLLLADLGWSQEEIDSLPQRVLDGEFTMADLVATAQQAVDEGVVEEGHGFYHRQSNGPDWLIWYYGEGGQVLDDEGKLVFDTAAAQSALELIASFSDSGITRPDTIGIDGNILHADVATAESVLFYQGGTWNWANWARNFVADRGGNDYLLENMSLMLFPALNDEVGPLTLTHPLSYMISSSSEHPDVAMALIAAVTTPEANNRHAIDSFHLGILNTQLESDDYVGNPAISQAHYMLDHTTAIPNDPGWTAWSNAWWTAVQAAAADTAPDAAVQLAVDQLTSELGDQITIR